METDLHSQLSQFIQNLEPSLQDAIEADRLRLLHAGIHTIAQLWDFVKALGSDETLRTIGIWFLTKLPTSESMAEDPIPLIRDPSPAVRGAAIEALGKLGNRDCVPLLISRLKADPFVEVKKMAAYALGLIGDARALGPLCTIAEATQEPEALRGMATEALGNLGEVAAAPTLYKLAMDTSSEVQYWSIYALGELPLSGKGLAQARLPLEELTTSSAGRVREQAFETLSRLQER